MPPRDRTKRRTLPTQDRSQASVDAILGAAELLLREQGFARMSTNRIAARAGVNVALVYRYFSGKEAIVGALIERTLQETHDAVVAAMASQAAQPLPSALRAIFEVIVTTPRDAVLHRELFEQLAVTKREHYFHDTHEKLAQHFAAFLGSRENELRPLADREAMMFVVQHAIEAATHAIAFYRPEGLSAQRALDALTELVVRSLTPGSPLTR